MFIDIIIFGTIWGAIYTILALGFTLIFGVARILNLPTGRCTWSRRTLIYSLVSGLGLPVFPAWVLAVAATSLVGMALYRIFIFPLRDFLGRVLIVTAGIAIFLQEVAVLIYSTEPRYVPTALPGSLTVLGRPCHPPAAPDSRCRRCARFPAPRLPCPHAPRAGAARGRPGHRNGGSHGDPGRADVSDRDGALDCAGRRCGGAGRTVPDGEPGDGLVAAAGRVHDRRCGRPRKPRGTIAAAFIVAYAEMLTAFLISPQLRDVVTFGIMILTLMFRPHGLFGKGIVE